MIGHDRHGAGTWGIIVLNDWICDTTTWDAARPYLDVERFTWVFADLRGYGRSMGMHGAFTIEEAASDVMHLAEGIGWRRFGLVGHSQMSALVALHLAQHRPAVERVVVLTPPPPGGFGADDARVEAMQAVARGDDAARAASLRARLGDTAAPGWVQWKTDRWRSQADPEAVAGYVAMFAQRGLPDASMRVRCPVLAVTGERDIPVLRAGSITPLLEPLCDQLTVEAIADSGHYPMQETPPLLVSIVEPFLAGGSRDSREV